MKSAIGLCRGPLVWCFLVGLAVLACQPDDKAHFDALDNKFSKRPIDFSKASTALWVSEYSEDPQSHRFVRSTAWGQLPDKLVPDSNGMYTISITVLKETETSDGPQPDLFVPVLVSMERVNHQFHFLDNSDLPGQVVSWNDQGNRTIHFRGVDQQTSRLLLWEFKGRY